MLSYISFKGKPANYKKIDNTLSRSAQPEKEDFAWLREQGITDIINFRTMYLSGISFDEKSVVEKNGMKYHNIPTYTNSPEEEDIGKFLDIVDNVRSHNGKVHIHCKAGADRTGMYSWIYKQTHKLGDMESNKKEMLEMGHHNDIYPDLIEWIEEFLGSK